MVNEEIRTKRPRRFAEEKNKKFKEIETYKN